MLFSLRRPAVLVVALAALVAAPLAQAPTSGAADAPSSIRDVTDTLNDTVKDGGTTPGNEPKADITAASARYQNDFVTFTMKLAKGDDLSTPGSVLIWNYGANPDECCNAVSLKKGPNGIQLLMGDPGATPDPADASQKCDKSAVSYDIASGTYSVSLPASCLSPASLSPFIWTARRVLPTGTGDEFVSDDAPNSSSGNPVFAPAVTNMKVTGYWAIGSDGKVYPFGDAIKLGEPSTPSLNTVDIEPSPHGTGYWTLDDKGAVSAFGPFLYGNVTDLKAGERAVSMSSTPSGGGYWVFTNKGRAIAFGDADKNIGDVSTLKLNGEIVDSSATPSGKGYYLTAADGGVFALGNAHYEGSMGDVKLNMPVQSIVPDPDGVGYWLVASDGGAFAFKAVFRGSTGNIKLNKPMTGMVSFGNGYLMVAEDGGVFNYSDRAFSGSLGDHPPANPIVSIAALN
jgi:hypothetical protein